jgi:hypothetical protein
MRTLGLALAAGLLTASQALAGSPHFVTCSATESGSTVTVTGKEAGLGDEEQIHVVLSVEAECINPGAKKPQAANKESFTSAGDFPVQNGRANFSLDVTTSFQPECSPPMTVNIIDISVCDTTNDICCDEL